MKKKLKTKSNSEKNHNGSKIRKMPKSRMKLVAPKVEIIGLLLEDHKPLKEMILVLKNPKGNMEKKHIVFEKFSELLGLHAKAEEKSLYVEMKENKNMRMEGFEGEFEHSIADQLMTEAKYLADGKQWAAKVKVLAELVEHHIEEEETKVFREVRRKIDLDTRVELGQKYLQLKASLSSNDGLSGRSRSLFVELLAS